MPSSWRACPETGRMIRAIARRRTHPTWPILRALSASGRSPPAATSGESQETARKAKGKGRKYKGRTGCEARIVRMSRIGVTASAMDMGRTEVERRNLRTVRTARTRNASDNAGVLCQAYATAPEKADIEAGSPNPDCASVVTKVRKYGMYTVEAAAPGPMILTA